MRKKLLSLLVLLMVAVTGAWATEVTIATNQGQTSYTSGDITISVSMVGDGDGAQVSSWCPMSITCGDGNVLQSVVVTIGFYPDNASDVTASAGSCEVSGDGNKHSTYVTVTGINASSVSIGCNGDVQIEQVVVNYSPSAPAVVASWVGNSAINANGTWYYAGSNFGWCTGGAFNGADLGTITTLSLGGQSQAWADGNANWNDGNLTMTMGYKIDGGADESLSLNWCEFADNNNKFQSGGSSWAAQDIDISGLTPGNHTIAVWFTRDDKWDSNNSANYVANFTIPTPAATTYTVTVKDGTEDADKWTADPNPAEAGQTVTVTYSGLKKVKSVKAVKKASAPDPVTYTALSGGEVLHVGDIIEVPDGQEWRINNSYIQSSRNPLTVVRANITFDQWDDVIVTEAADGAYYVIKDTGGWYYCTYEGFTLPVTGTSDGIYVTYNGILWDEYPDYTFSVHEPEPVEPEPAGPTAYTLAESTQGMIVGTNGLAYDVADKDNLPSGVTAAGVVVYKNGANGLAIALTDEASMMDWATACGESGAAAHTPTVEGQTWKLPSQEEWTLVKNANSGSSLNSAITNAGGTAIPTVHFDHETQIMTGQYWLSTQGAIDESARTWGINGYDEIVTDSQSLKTDNLLVRACLAW